MVDLTFVDANGRSYRASVDNGRSARDAALFNDVPGIDGDCGGVCACATCHVHVDTAWIERVGQIEEGGMEAHLLQFAEGTTDCSRLACQIEMSPALDGLVLHVPSQQY